MTFYLGWQMRKFSLCCYAQSLLVTLVLILSSCGVTPSGGLDETVSPAASKKADSPVTSSNDSALSVLPSAFTEKAVVTLEGAVLLGLVKPKSEETDVWFEWGTDPALEDARRSAVQRVHPGSALRPSYETGRLQGGVTYYYRIVASSTSGRAEGEVKSFTFHEMSRQETRPERRWTDKKS
jgi:hypothetical protein